MSPYTPMQRAGSKPSRTITEDRYCPCGYNLRTLNTGRNCPECGNPIESVAPRTAYLQHFTESQRSLFRLGLALGGWCVLIFVFLRILGVFLPAVTYAVGSAAAAAVWMLAIFLMTPRVLDQARPGLRLLRLAVRVLQLGLWPLTFLFFLARINLPFMAPISPRIELALTVSHSLALFTMIGIAALLIPIAEDMDNEVAPRRLNFALWLAPIPALLLSLMPDQVTYVELVFLLLLWGAWATAMVPLALGLFNLAGQLKWEKRLAYAGHTRSARLEQTRRELDQQVEAAIRPLPRDNDPDIPLAPM